jgi:O-antigen/teichoic acid export membrane protein
LAGQWLIPRGLDRQVTAIVVSAGVLNLALTPAVAHLAGPQGVAWALVSLEAGIVACMALLMLRERAVRPDPTFAGGHTS